MACPDMCTGIQSGKSGSPITAWTHEQVEMGSAALATALALLGSGDPNFPLQMNELVQHFTQVR